jgi:hypothetical protein
MRRAMTPLAAVLLTVFLLAPAADAAETLRELAWDALAAGERAGGTVLPPDATAAFARLRVEAARGTAGPIHVLTLEGPPVTGARYGLTGTVRYEGVEGTGFLEMWSVFPDGGRYFSRTLAPEGPLRALTGAADWRPFTLPFFNQEGAPPPVRLVVNVVLPNGGRVELGPLRLVQYGSGEDPLAVAGAWWSEPTGALIGAVLGSVLGLAGAVVGVLGGLGRARRTVLALMVAEAAAGALALGAGVVALVLAQPYAVYYPLLLVGVICTVLGLALLGPLRRRYQAQELRRLRAADTR